MPSTNQMIADLVAKGFELPEKQTDRGRLVIHPCFAEEHCYPGENGLCNLDVFAYDVITMAFARQADQRPQNKLDVSHKYKEFREHMANGDTEAAIKALWEGVCDGV